MPYNAVVIIGEGVENIFPRGPWPGLVGLETHMKTVEDLLLALPKSLKYPPHKHRTLSSPLLLICDVSAHAPPPPTQPPPARAQLWRPHIVLRDFHTSRTPCARQHSPKEECTFRASTWRRIKIHPLPLGISTLLYPIIFNLTLL
jgi:hypothetical protein